MKPKLLAYSFAIIAFILLTSACLPTLPTCPTLGLQAPEPDSPLSGEDGQPVDLSFTWHYPDPTCNPEGYRIDVTTYGGYDYGTTYSGGTGDPSTTWGVGTDLELATHYEWRVAAINGTTLGPYSYSQSFWTGPWCATAALQVPTPLGPPNGSIVNNSLPPISWSYPDPCTPNTFDIDLDTDSSFPGPNLVSDFDPTTGSPFIAIIPLTDLIDCTTYYWRVRSQNTDGASAFSPTWSFSTDFAGLCGFDTAPPYCDAAALIAPENLDPPYFSIVPNPPNLSWIYTASCVPEHYHVELTDTLNTSDPSIMVDTGLSGDTPGADTSWIPSGLAPATQYWWEVAGVVGSTEGPFSPRFSFITGPECAPTTMGAPVLENPPNGTEVSTPSVWLVYSPTGGCTPPDYYVDLQTDVGFPGPNLMLEGGPDVSIGVPSTFVGSPALTDCTLYFWRVAGQHGTTRGPWSGISSFFTNFGGTCTSPYPLAIPLVGYACLEYPYMDSLPLGYGERGDPVTPVALNLEGTWLQIINPNDTLSKCWVPLDDVALFAPLGSIPSIFGPKPTEAPTTVPVQGCLVTNQDKSQSCVAPCPPNAKPGTACTP